MKRCSPFWMHDPNPPSPPYRPLLRSTDAFYPARSVRPAHSSRAVAIEKLDADDMSRMDHTTPYDCLTVLIIGNLGPDRDGSLGY